MQILPASMTAQVFVFRDMIILMIFSKVFKKFRLKKIFKIFEDLHPVVGSCEGTSGFANLASEYDCSNPYSY